MQELKKKKQTHSSGASTLIISNEEMNDLMKIVQALEDSNILLKGVTKTIKNEKKKKEQKGGFLLGTLIASLLGNLLARKRIVRASSGNKKGKGIEKAGSGNKKGKGTVRAGTGRSSSSALDIIKMNQDLMVIFQEITYLKK